MRELIEKLQKQFPKLNFVAGRQFSWSPETEEIFFVENFQAAGSRRQAPETAAWSLLHETGHAILDHKGYQADFELLRLEIDAWEKARELAREFKIEISEDHIQDCLDTYRDWLYKRSICPNCSTKCLQQSDYVHYRCFNCHTTWKVTASRFCRAYRRKDTSQTTAVFHLENEF
jgi:hypothetical protein